MDQREDGFTVDETEIRVRTVTDEEADVAAIRADIRQTRERMSHTVEDIGERLNPDRLKRQLKDNIHDATIGKAEHMARAAVDRVDETRHTIMDSIRDNPIPAAMVGIGLGWLFLNGRKQDDYSRMDFGRAYYGGDDTFERSYYGGGRDYPREDRGRVDRATERVSEWGETARERGGELAHRAQETVTGLAEDARDTVSDVADRAQHALENTASRARHIASDFARETRYGTRRVEDRFEEAIYESPLAVGAAAMAIGLAVGLTAPGTRREAELMGGARDEMIHRAKHATREMSEKVQHVAERVVDQAETAAREAARDEQLL